MPRDYKTPTQDKIMEFLKGNNPSDLITISNGVSCSRANAHLSLKKLVKKKIVLKGNIKNGRGRPRSLYLMVNEGVNIFHTLTKGS